MKETHAGSKVAGEDWPLGRRMWKYRLILYKGFARVSVSVYIFETFSDFVSMRHMPVQYSSDLQYSFW